MDQGNAAAGASSLHGGRPGRPWGPMRGDSNEANELAAYLRRIVDGSGLTLRQVSDRLSYSRTAVSSYLSGNRVPDWRFVGRLIQVSAHDVQSSELLEARVRPLWRDAMAARSAPRTTSSTASDPESRTIELQHLLIEAQARALRLHDELLEAEKRAREAQSLVGVLIGQINVLQSKIAELGRCGEMNYLPAERRALE